MAWNPNVPTVTNRVQDDLNAIRENFQHLDQLAERVDELQTVSELAPIANDLQTVSGLAPVAGELQAVSGLAQITDDLQVVSELAPYVQALLDSRIVEMGSNSNGHYVRWENGLQLCAFGDSRNMETWFSVIDDREVGSGLYRTSVTTLPFPAAFAEVFEANVSGGRHHATRTMLVISNSRITWEFFCLHDAAAASIILYVSAFAIGRWK